MIVSDRPPDREGLAEALGRFIHLTEADEGQAKPVQHLSLRHGVAGCANTGASMTRGERERCEDELGRGVAAAPVLPVALEPRIRSYYNAVAEAKAE